MKRFLVSVAVVVAIVFVWTAVVVAWFFAEGLGIQRVPGPSEGVLMNGVGIAATVWTAGASVAVVLGAFVGRRLTR